jgi:multiple sugar transport system ATP-binding protein
MDHGVVQQVDTPMNIYHQPANRFVASFIGSPAMNFITGEITGREFRYAGGGSIPLDRTLPAGPATLGVRPEDILTNGDGLPLATAALDVVEQMGHETMVHFELSSADFIARLAPDTLAHPGERKTFRIRQGAYHLFAEDGRRLT